MLRLYLSAVQSGLFNVYLAEQLAAGALGRRELGEVVQVVASGGEAVVRDVEREQARFARRVIVPTGPMFGPKMRSAEGAPGERERNLLARAGLDVPSFARSGKLLAGTRRALLVWLEGLQLADVDGGLELPFALPAGSYAEDGCARAGTGGEGGDGDGDGDGGTGGGGATHTVDGD